MARGIAVHPPHAIPGRENVRRAPRAYLQRPGVLYPGASMTCALKNSDTWLIIPLFNEATVVRTVVQEAVQSFPNIVCVDDGSSDDSLKYARSAGATVLRHPINLGQGAALQTGLDYAYLQPGSRFFVTFDADGQHRVKDAEALVQRLRQEPLDIVIGSRFLDNRSNPGALKRIVLRLAVSFERLTTGVRLTDAHNGLRAMTRDSVSVLRITQNRMAHASEIIAQVGGHKLRYAEHPVLIRYSDYSRSKGQSLWNSVNILSDLLIN